MLGEYNVRVVNLTCEAGSTTRFVHILERGGENRVTWLQLLGKVVLEPITWRHTRQEIDDIQEFMKETVSELNEEIKTTTAKDRKYRLLTDRDWKFLRMLGGNTMLAQLAANAADKVAKQAAESVVRPTAEPGTGTAAHEQAGRGWGRLSCGRALGRQINRRTKIISRSM